MNDPLPGVQRPVNVDADVGWRRRLVVVAAAAGLLLGSGLFLMGGRAHPGIRGAAGPGPDEFFRAFAETVQHTAGWHGMHMMILVGPLVWAVAAPALMEGLRLQTAATSAITRSLLVMAGCLWATAFVLDGFAAPVYAQSLTSAEPGGAESALLTAFAANAVIVSRLGLLSWIIGGFGIAVLGSSLLPGNVRTKWRAVVGVTGVLLGVWPFLAALEGEYAGGPFTSRFWMYNALLVGVWYIGLATCAFGQGVRRSRSAA